MDNKKDSHNYFKLHEENKNFKQELAKNFLKYFEALSYNKKLEKIESIINKMQVKNLLVHKNLSMQEKKCIFLAEKGNSVKETARILQLSHHTVHEYRASAIKKLGASNITAAVALWIEYKKDEFLKIDKENFNDNLFDLLPACIYWKDLNGIFQGHNAFTLQRMSDLDLSTLVIGKTDYELFPKVADIYRKNDFEVMKRKKVIIYEEPLILSNNQMKNQLTIKRSWLNNNKTVGIIGITFDINKIKKTK